MSSAAWSADPAGCAFAPPPLVSVVVPHLNDLAGLAALAAALEQQTLPRDRFEIIVGDNGSSCGIDAVRGTIPGARVVSVAERGAGPARNGAVAAARGEIIAFTDSDCVPDPDWLAAGVAALDGADIIGGRVRVGVVDPKHPTMAEAFEAVFAFDNQDYVTRKGFSVTANIFVRRVAFDRVGPFRSAVSEDVEWCRRGTRAGLRIDYAHQASVMHPARRTFADLTRKWRRTDREGFLLWRDEGGSRAGWALRAFAVLLSPAVHWLKIARASALTGIGPRLSALAALVALRAMRCAWMLEHARSPQPAPPRHLGQPTTARVQ